MSDLNSNENPMTEEETGSIGKSKKQLKKENAWRANGPRDPFAMLNALPEKEQQQIQKALHLFSTGSTLPKSLQQAQTYQYRFWDTQPVPKLGDTVTTHGPVAETEASIREKPYSLPEGFSWDTLDISSPPVLKELCSLLNENYTEDDDNTIRFHFSAEYLQWALQPPNWQAQWHCGVRVNTNKKLVGFIAAIPADLSIYEFQRQVVQVRFLCVHRKLRLKRMTPVLIRELTRRVNLQGLRQAVYAAGVVVPTPLSSCRQWHRPLNVRKLMEVNYPGLKENMNLQRTLKFLRLPQTTKIPGMRPMTHEDSPRVLSLLQKSLSRFHLRPVLSLQDVQHWLVPRESVIDSYVIEGDDGELTDVVSFYRVSFKVLNHPFHSTLRAAHLFYIASAATDQADLVEDSLVLAKAKGLDVVTALDVMDNNSFLEKVKFSISPIGVHYYLYNWMCPTMKPDKVGLLLPN
ncbi:glycylpeptide N-tetradecanoyltransferase 2-like [Gouania willdenowi]|uniref:glycylpeptide N-tetradecanoyltransferase 2-like n=1 Tax=Gouania willdenowi TaxID=441366 RepID=UPI00105493A9|nr:glycylpeptide N-tetradecanoyltransferase 2-like [Gouania willdenowi]